MSRPDPIPSNEIWANGGTKDKPSVEKFAEGDTQGTTATPPSAYEHNFYVGRDQTAIQYLMRRCGLPWHIDETYSTGDRSEASNGVIYISLVDANTGKDPLTSPTEWEHELDKKFPINSVLPIVPDPATVGYPGVWAAISPETSLNFQLNDSSTLGTTAGENTPLVPVAEHGHTQEGHTHDKGTMNITGEVDTSSGNAPDERGTVFHTDGAFSELGTTDLQNPGAGGGGADRAHGFVLNAADSWTGETGETAPDIEKAGVADATINVQGKVINVAGWIRVVPPLQLSTTI